MKGRVVEYGDKPVAGAEVTLGGPISPSKTTTDASGRFTITASHRATQVLTLTVKKEGFAVAEEKFPGFAAPEGEMKIELMHVIPRTK